jgi:hypothetical protein
MLGPGRSVQTALFYPKRFALLILQMFACDFTAWDGKTLQMIAALSHTGKRQIKEEKQDSVANVRSGIRTYEYGDDFGAKLLVESKIFNMYRRQEAIDRSIQPVKCYGNPIKV